MVGEIIKIPGYFVQHGYFDLESRLFPSETSLLCEKSWLHSSPFWVTNFITWLLYKNNGVIRPKTTVVSFAQNSFLLVKNDTFR